MPRRNKNVKKHAAKTARSVEAPRELIETQPECSYSIMMMDQIEGTDVEQIEVSRQEYLAIKKLLIKMRGYAVVEVAHA